MDRNQKKNKRRKKNRNMRHNTPKKENLGGTTGIGLWISAFHAKWFRFFFNIRYNLLSFESFKMI